MDALILLEAAQPTGGESPFFVLLIGVLSFAVAFMGMLRKIGGDE